MISGGRPTTHIHIFSFIIIYVFNKFIFYHLFHLCPFYIFILSLNGFLVKQVRVSNSSSSNNFYFEIVFIHFPTCQQGTMAESVFMECYSVSILKQMSINKYIIAM